MKGVTIEYAVSPRDTEDLDALLWRVLWEPLGLPRNVRQGFAIDGESLELVARENGRVIGGTVAVWTGDNEVEVRHLVVEPGAQNRGIGRRLVESVMDTTGPKGCRRVHTIARNTSIGFFKNIGFKTLPDTAPEHPAFKQYGIFFVLMDRIVEAPGGR